MIKKITKDEWVGDPVDLLNELVLKKREVSQLVVMSKSDNIYNLTLVPERDRRYEELIVVEPFEGPQYLEDVLGKKYRSVFQEYTGVVKVVFSADAESLNKYALEQGMEVCKRFEAEGLHVACLRMEDKRC